MDQDEQAANGIVKLRQNLEEDSDCETSAGTGYASNDSDESELQAPQLPPSDKKPDSFLHSLRSIKWENIVLFVCLWIAYLLCNVAYSIIGPFFPQVAKDKGASPVVIGVIISCSPLCVAILSPAWGYVIPRVGVWPLSFMGLLLVGSSFLILGFVDMIPSTGIFIFTCILLRLTEGVGTAMFITSTFSTLPKLFPKSVATIMGLLEVASGIGYGLGPPLGGMIYQLGGYKLPLGGLYWSLSYLVLYWSGKCIVSEKKILSLNTIWIICTDLRIIVLGLVIVLAYSSLGFYAPILQPYLFQEFHLNPVQVGLVFTISSLSYGITSFIVGPISDKLGHRYTTLFGVVIVTLGYFTTGLPFLIGVTNIWFVRASFFFTGIGATFSVVPIYTDMLEISKRCTKEGDSEDALAAIVSGIIASTINFGLFLLPLVGGLMANFFPFSMSCVIIGEFLLAEMLLLLGVTVIDKINVDKCYHCRLIQDHS